MSVSHRTVSVNGERIGDAIALDTKVVFFTTRADFQKFDGRTFPSMEVLEEEIRAAASRSLLEV